MTAAIGSAARKPRSNEQLAWGVIWVAFAAFCLFCAAAGVSIYYFLFNSTIPVQSRLEVSRGTAGVTGTDLLELVVRDSRFLLPGDAVRVPVDAQSIISLEDTRLTQPVVASITLHDDSSATLNDASRARFQWGNEPYRIQMSDVSGDLDIVILPGVPRPVSIILSANGGDSIFLSAAGRYIVRAHGDVLEVANQQGEAMLVADDRVSTRAIPAGQRGILHRADNRIDSLPGYVNLLVDDSFEGVQVVAPGEDVSAVALRTPATWICNNPPHDPPLGVFDFLAYEGRSVIHLLRGDNATTHGETRCTFRFGPGALGVDISGYNYLAVQATFRIEGQSLAVCGVVGSECPLMLNMQYVPDGVNTDAVVRDPSDFGSVITPLNESPARNWYKGFFVVPAGGLATPLRCDSCPQEHSLIRSGEWYSYDSGNLLANIPQAQRPRYLLNMSFYGSGHEYEVYLSDLLLLVGNVETGG
jgi:hypothetical protein